MQSHQFLRENTLHPMKILSQIIFK